MRGIILAGGSGSRLHPLTLVTSKQLLPVYDKPMIYYPMSMLMLAGIREVLIISTPKDLPRFQELFRDGGHLGMRLEYAEQPSPDGLAQAFLIGQAFLDGGPACLVLGDNLMYGDGLSAFLTQGARRTHGAMVCGYRVSNPRAYGVVEVDHQGRAISLEEKPLAPRSSYAVPGIYFYDHKVVDFAASLKPSARGELEITDLNRLYMERGELDVTLLGRGIAWFDAGTHGSLIEAANFIATIEQRQGLKIACLEEIAWNNGWIDRATLERSIQTMGKSTYAQFLEGLLAGKL